ncbi:hypothetical protein D3C78_1515760 [compost metagenome]
MSCRGLDDAQPLLGRQVLEAFAVGLLEAGEQDLRAVVGRGARRWRWGRWGKLALQLLGAGEVLQDAVLAVGAGDGVVLAPSLDVVSMLMPADEVPL